jgi:thiol:disulfide interchange protein DsbD
MLSGSAWAQQGKATHRAELGVSTLRPGDKVEVDVVLEIAPGLHAQSHTPTKADYIKLVVKGTDSDAVKFGEPVYPPGHDAEYPGLGKLNVYDGTVVVKVPFEVKAGAPSGKVEVGGTITYQVCDDQTCFFPQRNKPWNVKVQIVGGGAAATSPAAVAAPGQTPVVEADAEDGGFKSAWTAFGAAFLAGLLFNVMPCVLPVLPLKAIGFYEVSQHHRAKSIAFGLVFSLGLIAVFAVLAMLVLVLRVVSWGELFSKGWFIWTIVTILVVMAVGMFDVFTFQLPTAVYNVTPRHDTYTGNFLFGGLTAILATPCTAPLFPPLLLWAASQSALVGVPAVVMVGVGMASPYMILSAFPEVARRMPRAGAGAELFKQMMAFMLLVAAAYFAGGRLIHGLEFWWLVTAVVAVAALFLVARTGQISQKAGAVAVSSVLAVAMVAGAVWWSARVTGLGRGGGAVAQSNWMPYSKQAFEQAREAGRPVLVKFTANWCGICQLIEGSVFADAAVWDELRRKEVVTLKADFSEDNPEGQELLLSLSRTGGIPLTAVYVPGRERPVTLASQYSSRRLMEVLQLIGGPADAVAGAK